MIEIRPAEPHELERLRAIAFAAKAHWGYDEALVRTWADGDVSAAALAGMDVDVAEVDGELVAWCAAHGVDSVRTLEHLWVEPAAMGTGIGSALFAHVAAHARGSGASRLEWESEPNAVGFYEKLGGRYLRDSTPTAWGRVVPVMGLDLR